jgi:RHS repeat-associated protein
MYYVHPDHLGSLAVITDAAGNIVQQAAFDAWGVRTFVTNDPSLVFDRGYTGHEHLDEFGLINCNARLYDPVLGRFLSPDPYVQDPLFSQSYNRYSYALNNPLLYTDPTGEFFFTAILGPLGMLIDAACWGAVIGGATYTASVALSDGGFSNWNWGDFGKSAGIGALSGFVTAGIGQMFGPVGSMGLSGEFGRAFTHAWANGMIAAYTGGDPLSAFAAGGLGSLAGSAFMMYGGKFASSIAGNYAFSGLAGGVGAELTGGNFLEGAATGLMVAGLNHLQQRLALPKSLEEKINEAWVQERARQAREKKEYGNPYYEPNAYISGVDFEINSKPYGGYEGVKYVYETTIDGVKVKADVFYNTAQKNKMVRYIDFDSNITPSQKTGGFVKGGYLIQFQTNMNVAERFDILRMTFNSMSHYQQYLRTKLY